MPKRPDQENWDTLQAYGRQINHGQGKVNLLFVKGWLAGWEEIETKRGHKAPLKGIEEIEEDEE